MRLKLIYSIYAQCALYDTRPHLRPLRAAQNIAVCNPRLHLEVSYPTRIQGGQAHRTQTPLPTVTSRL